jgi:hypothetical protein
VDSFLGIPLQEKTSTGNNIQNWQGVIGDFLITISAQIVRGKVHYIVYVDLCGFPEKWWPADNLKIAEAYGENILFLEVEIKRQLNRYKNINV